MGTVVKRDRNTCPEPEEYEVYEVYEQVKDGDEEEDDVSVIVIEEVELEEVLPQQQKEELEAAVASLNQAEEQQQEDQNEEEELPEKKPRQKSSLKECPLCGYRERNIPKHIVWCKKLLQDYWTIRNTNPNSHNCHICMYATNRRAALKEHIERHAPGHTRAKNFIKIQYYELFTHDPE